MAYVYNNETGNFDYVPDGHDGYGRGSQSYGNSAYDPNKPPKQWYEQLWSYLINSEYGDIAPLFKIFYFFVGIVCNFYIAYELCSLWLLLTIPLTLFLFHFTIAGDLGRTKKIEIFVGFAVIMATIILPIVPWWGVFLAVAIEFYIFNPDNR